jgi:hypothetical protein
MCEEGGFREREEEVCKNAIPADEMHICQFSAIIKKNLYFYIHLMPFLFLSLTPALFLRFHVSA